MPEQPLSVVIKNNYSLDNSIVLKSMPDRNIHKKISELIVGNTCEETHAYIDGPVKEFGYGHREFYHDPVSAGLIGLFNNGYRGAISGILHIIIDRCFNTYLSKETLRLSLKVFEHEKGKIRKGIFKN
jgi:hypothetical protein